MKHTKEYAEKLAEKLYLSGKVESYETNGVILGYMKAIEQTNVKELLEALKEIIKSCNPSDVTPNKKARGVDLGEFYVGGCGIPSDKAIHMAINAIKKAE